MVREQAERLGEFYKNSMESMNGIFLGDANAVSILADKEKWHPGNKETADHSLPFIIASTLVNQGFYLTEISHLLHQDINSNKVYTSFFQKFIILSMFF